MNGLDLRPLDEAMDDLTNVLSGEQMQAILEEAAIPMKDQWRENIISQGEVGDPPIHYAESLVIAPVFRRKTIATVEIAAEMKDEPDRDTAADRAYPAILEYGSATIVPRPVAMRAFDQRRRGLVQAIAAAAERRATSRRRRG